MVRPILILSTGELNLSFYPLEIGFVCSPLLISVKNKGKCDFYLFFLTFLSPSSFVSVLCVPFL